MQYTYTVGGTAAGAAATGTAGTAGIGTAGTAAGTAGAGGGARSWLPGPPPEEPRIPHPRILYGEPIYGSAAASLSKQTINQSGANILHCL